MKAVMISIQPKWCEKIASGEKTIEVRKTKPKCETPFKCYIYMTKKGNKFLTVQQGEQGARVFQHNYHMTGKVIGEFVCDKIYNFIQFGAGIMFADEMFSQLDPQCARDMTCLNDEQFFEYFGCDKDGYGWHISELKIYDKPKELSEFSVCLEEPLHEDCNDCCFSGTDCIGCGVYKPLIRPPQSWCYVEEKE